MRQFAFFLALFLALLLVVDRTGSRALKHVYHSMRGGQSGGQITAYLARPRPPALLVLGNSRVSLNIDPASFHPAAANLAHYGTGQAFGTGLLHVLQQQHMLPATILLHIDLDEYAQPAKPDEINQLGFYYHQNAYVAAQIDALGWAERVKNTSALYSYNARLFSLAKAWLRPNTSADFGFQPEAPSPHDSLATLYSGQQLRARPLVINRVPLSALREFVAVCRAERVQLICFTATYHEQPPYVARTSALVDSLLRAEHVPYLNYGLHPLARLQASTRYWHDVTHLNATGVPLQSQALARQVTRLRAAHPAQPAGNPR
jgi:hypothetical protein